MTADWRCERLLPHVCRGRGGDRYLTLAAGAAAGAGEEMIEEGEGMAGMGATVSMDTTAVAARVVATSNPSRTATTTGGGEGVVAAIVAATRRRRRRGRGAGAARVRRRPPTLRRAE